MNRILSYVLTAFLVVIFSACDKSEPAPVNTKPLSILDFSVDSQAASFNYSGTSLQPQLTLKFSEPIDRTSVASGITMAAATLDYSFSNGDSSVSIKPNAPLKYLTAYAFVVNNQLKSATAKALESGASIRVITQFDPSDKKTRITKDELLD